MVSRVTLKQLISVRQEVERGKTLTSIKRDKRAKAYGGWITTQVGASDQLKFPSPECDNLPLWSTTTPILSCNIKDK